MDIKSVFRRNWWAIFYFNFKMLPFYQAIKFPFDFYGKVKFVDLSGKIDIRVPIYRRMIEFGRAGGTLFPNRKMIISVRGKWYINGGGVSFGPGVILEVDRKARLEVDGDIFIAADCKIMLRKCLKIGSHVRVSWESQIFDSNFHYVRNCITGEIPLINKDVLIGDYVWIGNRVTINKGTVIPNHSIVASNSLCNKDFSISGKDYLTIAGMPAKIVNEEYERIFETLEESLCNELRNKEEENY